MSESYILKTFSNVKNILVQNTHIIDKIIEEYLEHKLSKVAYNRQDIYTQLCKIENFLLFFLYSTPISARKNFKSEVESCLTLVYEYRIRYSRIFGI